MVSRCRYSPGSRAARRHGEVQRVAMTGLAASRSTPAAALLRPSESSPGVCFRESIDGARRVLACTSRSAVWRRRRSPGSRSWNAYGREEEPDRGRIFERREGPQTGPDRSALLRRSACFRARSGAHALPSLDLVLSSASAFGAPGMRSDPSRASARIFPVARRFPRALARRR